MLEHVLMIYATFCTVCSFDIMDTSFLIIFTLEILYKIQFLGLTKGVKGEEFFTGEFCLRLQKTILIWLSPLTS